MIFTASFFKKLSVLLFSVVIPVITAGFFTASELPSNFSVYSAENFSLNTALPVSVEPTGTKDTDGTYNAGLKFLGVIPIKNITVSVVKPKCVTLCGTPFGVKIFTDGVMVVGLGDVSTEKGCKNPAEDAGIRIGDIITAVNGKNIFTNKQIAAAVEKSGGHALKLTVKRHGKSFEVSVKPVLSADDGIFKAGMWVRDSSAGIGTLTFIYNGVFGGLGHGICDIDTGEIIPLSSGEIVPVTLTEISKSSVGKPGELKGFLNTETAGQLRSNGEMGVYGIAVDITQNSSYPVAQKQEIAVGKAQIMTTLPCKDVKLYNCEIEKINYNEKNLTRNLIIKVTDEELLRNAGGIVQGMSGSPIIQNGKFIGAVTHVFVNNPCMGYGIFAENMIAEAEKCTQNQNRAAS